MTNKQDFRPYIWIFRPLTPENNCSQPENDSALIIAQEATNPLEALKPESSQKKAVSQDCRQNYFGITTNNNRLPDILDGCWTFAKSSTSFWILSIIWYPLSLWSIWRPLNCIVNWTLCPFSRNSRACLSFVCRSWSSVSGLSLISLSVLWWRWLILLASRFLRFCW